MIHGQEEQGAPTERLAWLKLPRQTVLYFRLPIAITPKHDIDYEKTRRLIRGAILPGTSLSMSGPLMRTVHSVLDCTLVRIMF